VSRPHCRHLYTAQAGAPHVAGHLHGSSGKLAAKTCNFLHLRVIFRCKTLFCRNLNQNCNILFLEHLIYGLYAYTCVFLLCQEFFYMILVNNPSFYDGGVTADIRVVLKLSARQRTLKMINNVFMVRNMLCSHKEYSSFLGDKLILFKLCNYEIVLAKV
jgi:hypothetical protein